MKGKDAGQLIADYRGVTEILRDQTGLWIRAHDLRRTLASEIFGTTQNVGTVEIALGHGSKQAVTRGYIQSAVEALRPLYEAREKWLRQMIGLDVAPAPRQVTEAQQGDGGCGVGNLEGGGSRCW